MQMSSLTETFRSIIQNNLDAYLRDLQTLTAIDCGTHQKAGLDVVARFIAERLHALDAAVQIIENHAAGNDVIGRINGKGGSRILLLCHTDTVYPPGTAASRPYRVEGNRAFAPGIADMKAGLLSALYALAALRTIGYDDFARITVICNSDEEAAPRHSVALIQEEARQADVALCLEAARANGSIVSARKGVAVYSVTAHGRESHAGVAPEAGRNAIVALADRVLAIWGLNGLRPGLTVNPGVFKGGTTVNTVPGEALCRFDVRVVRQDDLIVFESALVESLGSSLIPDITFEVETQLGMPPMEKTEASARLVRLAQQAAGELGFHVVDTATGGGSDGSYAAAVGTPTLDGLGPIGGSAHSEWEYIELDSIVPRTAMLARLITLI
jgi:glutamate carboxypeptidase